MERLIEPSAAIDRSPISRIRDKGTRWLLGEFLYSPEFDFGVGKVKEFLLLEPEQREMPQQDFRTGLVGFFFGNIAYWILKEKLTDRERLLSPQETDEFYDLLYPTRPESNPYGLGLQVEGITVPDGILITEHEDKVMISGVLEYSLTYPNNTDNTSKIRQLRHYGRIEEVIADFTPALPGPVRDICFPEVIRRRFGLPAKVEFDPDFEVIFVFPRDDREDLYSQYYRGIPGRIIFLPIPRPSISIFSNAVFNNVRDSLGLSVE